MHRILKNVVKRILSHFGLRISRRSAQFIDRNEYVLCRENCSTLGLDKSYEFKVSGEAKLLHWVIPAFRSGSGGHMTIFRIAQQLESYGFQNHFWIFNQSQFFENERDISLLVEKDFVSLSNSFFHFYREPDGIVGGCCIATDRWSAYLVRSIAKVAARAYFVQDFEPDFYPKGSEYFLTLDTYGFGFHIVTAGTYLKLRLKEEMNVEAHSFDLAIDRNYYFLSEHPRRELTIAFYARTETPRRCFELGILALGKLALDLDVTVIMFGQPPTGRVFPFKVEERGICGANELADIYRTSMVGLVLSATNYSIVPNEMMACGLPVVELDTPCNRIVYPKGAIALAAADPVSIASNLWGLLKSESLCEDLRKRSSLYADGLSWENSGVQVANFLNRFFEKESNKG